MEESEAAKILVRELSFGQQMVMTTPFPPSCRIEANLLRYSKRGAS